MKVPCQNLTISRVTISDIGTKFLQRTHTTIRDVMKRRINNIGTLLTHLREDKDPSTSLLNEEQEPT